MTPASIEISEAPTGLSLQGDDAPVPFLLEVHTLPQGRPPLCEALSTCPRGVPGRRRGAACLPSERQPPPGRASPLPTPDSGPFPEEGWLHSPSVQQFVPNVHARLVALVDGVARGGPEP